jgi:RNA polymerase-binding transcription factor DksA
MPDLMDSVQDRLIFEHEQRNARRAEVPPGFTECETCDEPIAPVRQALGARLCIECQQAAELRMRQRSARGAV